MRKRKHFIIFTAIFLPLFIFTPSVKADNEKVYKVGTDNLNVRIAPSYDAKIEGKLKFGDHVTGFKKRHGWISTYYDGTEVWVASQYLLELNNKGVNNQPTKNESTSNKLSNSITINEDAVHLRDGPSTEHTIVGKASKGDTYSLVESSNDWHKVRLNNGNTGWVASWLTNKAIGSKTTSTSTDNNSPKSTTQNASTNSTSQSSKPLTGYNIILDPGHGGHDPGALGINGKMEKGLVLDYTNVVAQKLRNEGATVLLTRTTDTYVSLKDRVNISNSYWTDAFISLHFNAFTSNASNGISTHYYANGAEKELAHHIQAALEKHTNLRSRGVRKDDYHVLRENRDTSILVELGFITNPYDIGVIQNSNYSYNVAEAISEGLIEYFNK